MRLRPGQHQLAPNIFQPNRSRGAAFVLLGRKQEFVHCQMTRALDNARIDQERAVGTNRNFGPVRKRNRGADVDLYFARRESHPKKRGLERKRWNYFTAILKQ